MYYLFSIACVHFQSFFSSQIASFHPLYREITLRNDVDPDVLATVSRKVNNPIIIF